MVKHGATTIWELWNGDTANPAMNSHNHIMLLGDLMAPGFTRIWPVLKLLTPGFNRNGDDTSGNRSIEPCKCFI
jgi:hypothetical protein